MNTGDKLEIKVRDGFWHAYFKREIILNDEKEKNRLLIDLKNIGVDIQNWGKIKQNQKKIKELFE